MPSQVIGRGSTAPKMSSPKADCSAKHQLPLSVVFSGWNNLCSLVMWPPSPLGQPNGLQRLGDTCCVSALACRLLGLAAQ